MRSPGKREYEFATCTVPADAAQLTVLTDFLHEFWSAASLASTQRTTFELALEEIFINVVKHGTRPGRVPSVEVSLVAATDGVTMTIEDDSPQFDPLSLPAPDITAGLAERPVGGLGVFLVRQVMDEVTYQRVGNRNRLSMTKYQVR
jgi:anti-sigma regulatory factor (Ser/Thr protein kinase)